ncbi:MAG TPA: Crp/Fnr family transcriptional regulator [Ohtaekwangia sp.]|uniref:Crp/Fnr family transcriptional regulator n=1 Tax=Ohtaekwangia sp. TaxID=2066019 RepID=UPI002F92D2E3
MYTRREITHQRMKALLKKHIQNRVAISNSEADKFCDLFAQRTVKKKSFLLRKDEICRFEGFVTKGLFRIYHLDHNGFEQILYFAMEDWWLTDIDSFNNQTPSQLFIEALEDSEVLLISKEDKEYAYENIAGIEKLFRTMTQKTHTVLQRRMIDSMSKSAYERYIDFIQTNPGIAQRLTNLQVAAYLGISHEFLSKIRRKIQQQGQT